MPMTENDGARGDAEEDGVRQHRAGRRPIALGVAARDDRLGADAQRAEAAAEEPDQDERGQERGLPVRRLGAGQVREEDDVDLVDDALREHRDDRGEREPEDRRVAMSLVHERRCEVDRLHANRGGKCRDCSGRRAKDKLGYRPATASTGEARERGAGVFSASGCDSQPLGEQSGRLRAAAAGVEDRRP